MQPLSKAFAIVATLALFMALGIPWVSSLYQTPTYEATVKMLVSQKAPAEGPNISWDGGDPQPTTLTVLKVVSTEPVARRVVEQLKGLDFLNPGSPGSPELSAREVLANVSVEPDLGTMFINISYKDSDPQRAQLIANTIAKVSVRKMSDVMLGAYSPLVVKVWQPAALPKTPVSPNPVRNMLLALATWGLMLGLLITVRAPLGNPMRVQQKNVFPAYTASLERSKTEGAKEQELLEALGRRGELTAAGVALETSLTVEEADRILFRLAAKGYLRVRASETGGGVFYSFWPLQR